MIGFGPSDHHWVRLSIRIQWTKLFNPNESSLEGSPMARRPRNIIEIPIHFAPPRPAPAPAPKKPSPSPAVPKKPAMAPQRAAIVIQSSARRFLARKNVAKVRSVAEEAKRIADEIAGSLEALLGDERERARVGEMLMRQILKLDGVRGARDCRRKVLKKLLAIQETVDAMEATGAAAGVAEEDEADEEFEEEILTVNSDAAENYMEEQEAMEEAPAPMETEMETLRATVAAMLKSSEQQMELVRSLAVRVSALEDAVRRLES